MATLPLFPILLFLTKTGIVGNRALGIGHWALGIGKNLLPHSLISEWHAFKPKDLCNLVPSLQAGNVFPEALPLVKKEEAEPPGMGSQPPGWEPVRAKAVY